MLLLTIWHQTSIQDNSSRTKPKEVQTKDQKLKHSSHWTKTLLKPTEMWIFILSMKENQQNSTQHQMTPLYLWDYHLQPVEH